MINNKLFFAYNVGKPIEDIQHNYKNTTDYLIAKTALFINLHNPSLTIAKCEPVAYKQYPDHIFIITYTKTNVNHPYLTYSNIRSPHITILIPIGKEKKQCDFDDIYNILDNEEKLTKVDFLALYVLVQKTIIIRKNGILVSDRFSILRCEIMANCKRKMRELRADPKYKRNAELLSKEIEKYRKYYEDKGVKLIGKYFDALEDGDFEDAYQFLKGNNKKSKYFGRERLNTFFTDTRQIIGHLQIFIPLYEILSEIGNKF